MLFSDLDKKLLVLQNVAEEGFYRLVEARKKLFTLCVFQNAMTSPRERLMDRSELKSVLRALAKVGFVINIFLAPTLPNPMNCRNESFINRLISVPCGWYEVLERDRETCQVWLSAGVHKKRKPFIIREAVIYVLADFVPPYPLNGKSVWKKKVFFLNGIGGYPPPP